jgi:hypothetical protein
MTGLPATSKYYGEQDERHGGPLHWPGINGIPFRGDAAPTLKRAELNNLPVVAVACHQTFNLSDAEHAKVYQWIRDRIRNGLFTMDWIERHWDDQTKIMWVYVEWSQLYTELPQGWQNRSLGNGSPDRFVLSHQ